MGLFDIFAVYQDIIQIHYDKRVKFFSQNLVDITLKTCRDIREAKKHYLILEIAISGLKHHLPFIAFFNLYLMVCVY